MSIFLAKKKKKVSSTIRLFIGLFMTLNITIIVIGASSYIYTLNTFTSAVYEQNISTINNVKSLIENEFKSLELTAQDIYLNVNTSGLQSVENIYDAESLQMAGKLITVAKYQVDRSNIFTDVYIYLSKSDSVISNHGLSSSEVYFNNYVSNNTITFEEWKESLMAHKTPIYRSTLANDDASASEYLKPFNVYSESDYGCIVVNFDGKTIYEPLVKSQLLNNANNSIVYEPQQMLMVDLGDSEINNFVIAQDLSPGQHYLSNSIFGDLIVVKSTSLNGNWVFTSTITKNSFYGPTDTLKIVMVSIVILQIILGTYLTILFSKKSYHPIEKLTTKLKDMLNIDEHLSHDDDIAYIQDIAVEMVNKQMSMQQQIDETAPIMVGNFLNLLLHGNSFERGWIYKHFTNQNELFSHDGFIVIKVTLEDCSEFIREDNIAEWQLAKFVVMNVGQELFEKKINTVCVDYDLKNVVFIMNTPYVSTKHEQNDIYNQIDKLAKKIQDTITTRFLIYTSTGVSLLHEGLQSLHLCHKQATQALNQTVVSGLYGINHYTELSVTNNNYSYSLQDEIYLINNVKTGEYDKVKQILDSVIKENEVIFQNNNLLLTQCFFMDLISTMFRVVEELNVPSDVINFSVAEILSSATYSESIAKIYKHYETISNWICKNKKSHNTKMKEQIENYLTEHCLDNSLSLVGVADFMGLNPTYLSVFFKEQFGENFLSYVSELRMKEAKRLLKETDMSQQDIATKIGYANSGVFIRVFKKKYGQTPGNYRSYASKTDDNIS